MAQTLTRRIVTRVVLPTALLLSLALVTAQQYAREAVSEQRRARLLDQAQLHAANLALALAAAPAPGDLSELPIDGADPEAAVGFGLLVDGDGRLLVDGGVRGLTAEALARASADLPPGRTLELEAPSLWVARSPVPGTPYALVRGFPVDEALSRFDRISAAILAVLLVFLTAVTAAAAALAARTTRPLGALAEASREVAAGNLERLASDSSIAEVHTLTAALNAMIVRLRQREQALAAANAELEARVEDRTARLEFSLDALDAFYWTHDYAAGTIEFLSPRFWTRLGYAEDEITTEAAAWTGFVHPEERDAALAAYEAHLAGRAEQFVRDLRFRRADGGWTWIRHFARVVARDEQGAPRYVAGLALDISEEKALEAQIIEARDLAEEATRAKSDFLANMSHEIRTPMNAIIGLSHLALQTPLDDAQRNYILKVHGAAENLLRIINDILDFSKIEAGHLEIEATDFSLDDLLADLTNLLGLRAEEKGLELLFDVDPDLPTHLVGDPLRLTQVLVNLCSNAVKFTEHGEVVVRIDAAEREGDALLLRMAVRDTGIGMDEDALNRLFRAFGQADASISRRYGGTGLGLIIARRLTQLMGGRIEVESTPGRGSTFTVTARVGVQQEQPAPVIDEEGDLAGTRVLVIDDNATALEILLSMTAGFGLRPEAVRSGEEALARVTAADADDPFTLLLVDWRMPGLDGVELARRLRADESLTRPPALVMVTAFGREAETLGADAGLFAAVVPKPVTPSSLLDGIMRALGRGLIERRRGTVRMDAAVERLRGARVLLVEDNEINQEVAVDLLAKAGLEVAVAGDGQAAIDRLAAERFDGVLMDCQMPVLDGYEATRRLRADPAFRHLPIIAMTANAMAGDRERALAAGMNDHVPKPINVRVLFETLARWVVPSEPATPAPAAPAAEASRTLVLPEIEGIDGREALARCHGDTALLLRTLRRFRDRRGDLLAAHDDALAAGDRAGAVRAAHTLKGLAGTLGAADLGEAARRLEADTEAGVDTAAARAELARCLEVLRPGLEALGDEEETRPGPALDDAERARLDVALAALRGLLEESDAAAGELLREHGELIARGLSLRTRDRLAAAVADWDFEAALELLAGSEEATRPATTATTPARADPDQVLAALHTALAEHDVAARELLASQEELLLQRLGVHHVAALREALGAYDFEAAAAELAAAEANAEGAQG